jgi:hypothetical protein
MLLTGGNVNSSGWARRGRLRSAWLSLLVGALGALAAGSCGGDALTEIIVVVDSDLRVPAQIDEVFVRVVGAGQVPQTAYAPLSGAGSATLPLTVGLTPKDGKAGPVTIRASGRLAGAEVLATEVRTSFVDGRRLVVRMSLLASCLSVAPSCGAGQTCRDGRCVDATVDPSTLPRFDGEDPGRRDMGGGALPDGGPDAGDGGTPDAGCMADAQCDDGNACNGVERCVENVCASGSPLVCDDGIACTTDACDPASGCVATPDDGRCTAGPGGRCDRRTGCQYTVCDATTCAAGPCESARCEGTTCVRTRSCASDQMCCGGTCVRAGCDDGNDCTADACGAAGCEHMPQPGLPCSDGNACTVGDACGTDGTCRAGGPRACSDGNPCTDDGCDPASGCRYVPNAATCSDGDPCTTDDRCSGGVCQAGAPCNDGIACTVDTCGAGGCVFTPNHSLCTAAPGGTCNAAAGCQYPSCSPATCADTTCETASCEGTTCVRRPRVCPDDGNPCTVEACDPMMGCRSTPRAGAVCNDGDGCTENDRCTSTGACVGMPRSCDDGNFCTIDSCSGGTCRYMPRSCDDGIACTADSCTGGACVNTPRDWMCAGAGQCTLGVCEAGVGCTTRPAPDFQPCSTGAGYPACDYCSGGACQLGDYCPDPCFCQYTGSWPLCTGPTPGYLCMI